MDSNFGDSNFEDSDSEDFDFDDLVDSPLDVNLEDFEPSGPSEILARELIILD